MTAPSDDGATEPAQKMAQKMAQQLALAEEHGAARIRAQLRAVVAEHRRVVRVRDLQVEVVETAALAELLEGRQG